MILLIMQTMESRVQTIANKIAAYLPDGTSHSIAALIIKERVVVKITRPRLTKLGDYRPPFKKETHRISVNGDLNIYSFLVTLLHEFAHLYTWNLQKNLENPHGKLWKSEFQKLLKEYLHVFPQDIQDGLDNYLKNPKASSCTDEKLTRILNSYDDNDQTYLEDIPFNVPFRLQGGKEMLKKEKLRKRFKCEEIRTKRIYLVNPLAEVHMLED